MQGNDTIQFYGGEIGLPDEHYITITNHPADGPDSGMDIGNELMSKLGPIILDIMNVSQGQSDSEEDARRRANAIIEANKAVFKVFPGNEMRLMAKRILKFTKVHTGEDEKGKPVIYDFAKDSDFSAYFKGNYGSVIPLMNKVISHNGFLELDVFDLGQGSQPNTHPDK